MIILRTIALRTKRVFMLDMNRILLVDDSPAMRRNLRREFEGAGWVVCGEATNGEEAIVKAEQLRPQVILLDLSMPGINGLTAARRLKRHERIRNYMSFCAAGLRWVGTFNTIRLGCKRLQIFRVVICLPFPILPATVHSGEQPRGSSSMRRRFRLRTKN
jgi:CheY-like chemotaxis protein